MARYGSTHYGTGFYGAPPIGAYSADPFVGTATDYGEITLTWTSPGGLWDEIVLVRNYSGFPVAHDNGTVIYTAPYGADAARFRDSGLPTDRWVYYALYAHDPNNDDWVRSGFAKAYVPANYHAAARFANLLPEIAQSDALIRFLSVIGFSYDMLRNDANSLLDLYDAGRVEYERVSVLMEQFGIPPETELEPEQYRRFLRNAVHFYKTKGTSECVHGVVSAVTGWDSLIKIGKNLLWTADDSDFVGGIGGWGSEENFNCAVTWVPPTTDDPPALRATAIADGSIALTPSWVDSGFAGAIPVTAGRPYNLSMLIRASDLAQSIAYFGIGWIDVTQNVISTDTSSSFEVYTRQGVDTEVRSGPGDFVAPAGAVLAVPIILVTFVTAGSYWDIRQVMFNEGESALPHEPGRDIRISLFATDTDVLRKAVHLKRLNDILPRYLPLGATFTLLLAEPPPIGGYASDDTILVNQDPPPPTAPIGRNLALSWGNKFDNASLVALRWNERQAVSATLHLLWNEQMAVAETAQLLWDDDVV